MIWTHTEQDLLSFTSYLSSIHPTLKFTSNHSSKSLSFLDVKVVLNNGTIEADLYTKPTDKHQYLLQPSCHPHRTKRARPVDKQVNPNNSKLTAVSEHFLSPNHSASDMQLIPLELIKSNRDDVRKTREAHPVLILKAKRSNPKG